MKIYYIWDPYCAWCYGFDSIFEKFMSNHPELELEILSGGLFVNNDAKKLEHFSFFAPGSKKINEIYGVEFGEKFYNEVEKGDFFINSTTPANAFSIMRKYLDPKKHLLLTNEIHKIFFYYGNDMNDLNEYIRISKELGIYSSFLEKELLEGLNNDEIAWKDYRDAMKFNVQVFPTAIVSIDGNYFDLKQNTYTLQGLEDNFNSILKLISKNHKPLI